jgi:hypothetical protein
MTCHASVFRTHGLAVTHLRKQVLPASEYILFFKGANREAGFHTDFPAAAYRLRQSQSDPIDWRKEISSDRRL